MKNIFQINPVYKKSNLKNEMQDFFDKESFLQLTNFFTINLNKIKFIILDQKFTKHVSLNAFFETLILKNNFQFEIIQLVEFFKSNEFRLFLEEITNLPLSFKSLQINKYSKNSFQNKDYNKLNQDVLEIYYDLSDLWNEKYSGFTIFSTLNENIFYLEPIFNSLTILFRSSLVDKQIEKINNFAKNKNILRLEVQFEISEQESLIE